jgi:sec-independent protein translocase protein TatA
MELSPLKLLIIAVIVLILFGRGRISEMMGDFGKGIKEFKKGMGDEAQAPSQPVQPPVQQIEGRPVDPQSPPAATPAPTPAEQKQI